MGSISSVSQKLSLPTGTRPWRISWIDVGGLLVIHLLALLAFVPWLFSWTGAILALVGLYVFGTLGISICFHRLLTHRGMVFPKSLEHAFAILGICSMQDTPARWVAMHRRHHEHSDEQPDPHSPLVNFFWAHMGWLMFKNRDLTRLGLTNRYAKDVLRDRFYVMVERKTPWLCIVMTSWMLFFAGGFIAELLLGGTAMQALQFGLSLLVWGVFVRVVLVWHNTWAVNSVTHIWGYLNYNTDESSRNNLLVGYLTAGEGWHNNHHAHPRSARYGHMWWELDVAWLTIRLLEVMGLAHKVVRPPKKAFAHVATKRLS